MKKVIYYVASSLDGYIAGPEDDIGMFAPGGKGVEKYLADLQDFRTVIMGRRTYEFGYRFGLVPGQPAYPHMEHYIFSKTLTLDSLADNVRIRELTAKTVRDVIEKSETDVYLCGGGEFAGWMLDHGLIDRLKLKLNPIILGAGIPLFGNSTSATTGRLVEKESFENGLEFLTYDLK